MPSPLQVPGIFDEGVKMKVPLPTKGDIFLHVAFEGIDKPTWKRYGHMALGPLAKPLQAIQELPSTAERMRKEWTLATVAVTILSATELKAADHRLTGGATSDPYVKVYLGESMQKTSTQRRTLEPQYNETFEFTARNHVLTDKPMKMEVFDYDATSRDDSLGIAEYPLTSEMLFEIHASGEGREFKLPLTTKGSIFIKVVVAAMEKPSYQELGLIHCEPVVKPLVQLKDLPTTARVMQREQSEAHITITLKGGAGLKAADRGGTSDPYVKFTLGEETYFSDVIPKTLNPVWDKDFSLSAPLIDMQRATLHLEVFDDDLLSRDDSLGVAELEMSKMFGERSVSGDDAPLADLSEPSLKVMPAVPVGTRKDFTLRLSEKGTIEISVTIDKVVVPSRRKVAWLAARPLVLQARGFFLYYRVPYDRSFFSKIRDPVTIVFMLVAAFPNVYVRGIYFSLYLLALVYDCEEAQMMRFIIGLKGTQFISGALALVLMCQKFWTCAVIPSAPGNYCALKGPGVSQNPKVVMIFLLMVWQQVLLWIAFLLVPYSRKYDPATGKLSSERADALWELNKKLGREEAEGIERRMFEKRTEKGIHHSALNLGKNVVGGVAGLGKNAVGGGLNVVGGVAEVGVGGVAHLGKSARSLISGKSPPPSPPPSPPWAGGGGSSPRLSKGDGSVHHGATFTALPATQQVSENVTRRDLTPLLMGDASRSDDPVDLEAGDKRDEPGCAQRMCTAPARWFVDANAYFKAVTYPVRHAGRKNRLLMLLKWDIAMFIACCSLFLLMMLIAIYADEHIEALAREDVDSHAVLSATMARFLGIFDPTTKCCAREDEWGGCAEWDEEGPKNCGFWGMWQVGITFKLVKVAFQMSTVPFFVFSIGALNKLFTHTDPTAYMRSGRVTTPDPTGLSGYLEWLKADILGHEPFEQELADNFPEKGVAKLHKVVAEAEELLATAWERPATAVTLTRKKKIEVDKVLGELVTEDVASPTLFKACFPDKILIREYIEEMQEKKDADEQDEMIKKDVLTPRTRAGGK